MTGMQRPLTFMSATIDVDNGKRTLDYLSFATIDGGAFGKTSTTGFLVDGKIHNPGRARWADALLRAGRGSVKLEGYPRVSHRVTFRVANDDERDQAWAHIHEVRPLYNKRMNPGDVRIILVELDED